MKKILFIVYVTIIFSLGGENPWATFNIPSNAGDLSLSRANISKGTVGFYQFSNPALLPTTSQLDYGICNNRMSLDRSTEVFSLNLKLPPNAGVGISLMRSGTSNIQGTDIFNNKTDILSNHDILGMISFGVSINKYFSMGINIKASSSNLDNILYDDNNSYSISNKGIGIDGGLLFNYSKLALAVKLENIKSSKSWNLNLNTGSNSYDEEVPLLYRLGTHYSTLNDKLIFYLSGDNALDSFSLNKFGLEIAPVKANLKIKCGVSKISGISPTLGFDYHGKIWGNILFNLNYGIAFGSVDEGMSHIFTWTFIR